MTTELNSRPTIQAETARREDRIRWPIQLAILIVGVSALAVLPFFFLGSTDQASLFEFRMPYTHDIHLHYEQMESFHQGLTSGEIYPRWEEDTNRGFGAPTTSYYPVGIYYLTSFGYALFGSWVSALVIAHLLMMVASLAAAYLYIRRTVSRAAAALAAIAYAFLPYHLIDQYQRGALAELLSFVWMPLILYFAERLFALTQELTANRRAWVSRTLLNGSGLALSLGAFIWSHPPTAYQFLLSFAAFALLAARLYRSVKGLVLIGIASAFGLGLSAAYMLPAALEQDLIRHEYVSESWPYHASYVFWHKLPFAQYHQPFFNLLNANWILCAAAIVICLVALFILNPKREERESGMGDEGMAEGKGEVEHLQSDVISSAHINKGSNTGNPFLTTDNRWPLKRSVLLWATIGSFASFMMTRASQPIGQFIPKIDIGVFTWRMMSITTLAVALLVGAVMQAALTARAHGRRAAYIKLAAIAIFITFASVSFSVAAVMSPIYKAAVFVPETEHINDAMIPRTAPKNPRELPLVPEAELANGNGTIALEQWQPQHRRLQVEVEVTDQLLIRTFDFPGWKVTVNGQPATVTLGEAVRVKPRGGDERLERALTYDASANTGEEEVIGTEPMGDIVIALEPGRYDVQLDFTDTPARRTGRWATMLTVVVVVSAIVFAYLLARRQEAAK